MLPDIKPHSPVPYLRDFIWVAEYSDGTYLSEYDFLTKNENSFYSIRKQDAIRFGLFGHGYKFYYETFGGYFIIPVGIIDLVYKVKDKEYDLTRQNIFYNDLITYKKAESTFNPSGFGHISGSNIVEYVFGYKQKLSFDDIDLNLKVLFKIPFGMPMYFTVRLVANREVEGKLQIKRDGIVAEEIDAPLSKDIGGEYNWVVN